MVEGSMEGKSKSKTEHGVMGLGDERV